MSDTTVDLPRNLSYSQKSTLSDCGGRYFLERALNVPQRPGWANVGGSAAHSTTEELDRRLYESGEHIDDLGDIAEIFYSYFRQQVEETEVKSRFERTEFRASGRASKEWPDKENHLWWAKKGPEMCLSWVRWRDASPYQIATVADGDGNESIAIELECRYPIGGTEVHAFVDRLMVRETPDEPEHLVLDLKFGSREPSGPDQLVTYRFGILDGYGVDPRWGTYWLGRKGVSTAPADLHTYSWEQVEYDYRMANEQRLRGDFRYHPANNCVSWCSVKEYCPIANGEYAKTIPQPWELTAPPALRPPKEQVS